MIGFFSECDRCDQLLADYLSVANQIVDVEKQVQTRKGFIGLTMASVQIRDARRQRNDALEKFLMHKKQEHGLEGVGVKTRARLIRKSGSN